jgi:beta-fructofuranosidase
LSHDGKWSVIIGSWNNNQGMAILYRSEDFFNWTKYQDPLYSTERTGMWECPDFYPVSVNSTDGVDTSVLNAGVKHVMKASFNSHDYYMIGTYVPEIEKYIPDNDFTGTGMDLRYDHGKFYASKTFFDSVKNRRILWGWVNESDSIEDDMDKGWSGLQVS